MVQGAARFCLASLSWRRRAGRPAAGYLRMFVGEPKEGDICGPPRDRAQAGRPIALASFRSAQGEGPERNRTMLFFCPRYIAPQRSLPAQQNARGRYFSQYPKRATPLRTEKGELPTQVISEGRSHKREIRAEVTKSELQTLT